MYSSYQRISAMFLRYLYVHKRSVSRALEFVFWPVMELLVWGFVSLYIQSYAKDQLSHILTYLLTGMIFWDLLYRSQQGVSLSFMEDIWTHNIINLLISPLRLWEWFVATFLYGFFKTLLITAILSFLAFVFYAFDLIDALGFYLIPMMANLLLFGWVLGIITSALLIRWGHAVEALIWGIPFLIQPLSAIFYPLSILPSWVQLISKCLPSTYVFEGMRLTVQTGEFQQSYFFSSLFLNLIYFVLAGLFYRWLFQKARYQGRLARLGMD